MKSYGRDGEMGLLHSKKKGGTRCVAEFQRRHRSFVRINSFMSKPRGKASMVEGKLYMKSNVMAGASKSN